MYKTCSELGIFMYGTGDSMNNLLSYWLRHVPKSKNLGGARSNAARRHLPAAPSDLPKWLWRVPFFKCLYYLGIGMYNFAPVKDYITTFLSKFRHLKTKKNMVRGKKWTNGNCCKVSQVLHVIFHFDQIWIFGNFRQSETSFKQRCLKIGYR